MKKLAYIIGLYFLFRYSFNFFRGYFDVLKSYGDYLTGFDIWKTQIIYVVVSLLLLFYLYRKETNIFLKRRIENFRSFIVLFPFIGALLILITTFLSFFEVYNIYPIELSFIFITLFGAILIGIHEEIIFRGIIFHKLSQNIELPWAIFISALLFSFVHLGNIFLGFDVFSNIYQIFYTFFFGILFAGLYFYTKNLLLLIFLHCVHDFSLITSDYLFHFIGNNENIFFPYLLSFLNFVFLSFVSIYILSIIMLIKIKKQNV